VLSTGDGARHGISKAHRITLQMPACVTVCATGQVDPAVIGSSAPSAPATNCSMIASARMRFDAGLDDALVEYHRNGPPRRVARLNFHYRTNQTRDGQSI